MQPLLTYTDGDKPIVLGQPTATPWNRRPQEPTSWYTRFSKYFLPQDASSRSLVEAYRRWRSAESTVAAVPYKYTLAPDYWEDAARKWEWRERAAWYDAHILERARLKDEEEKVEMLSRQRLAGRKLQELAIRRLIEIEANLSLLNATEARKYLAEGAHLEREARGLPGTVVQTNVGMVQTPQVSLQDFDWRAAVGLSGDEDLAPEPDTPPQE